MTNSSIDYFEDEYRFLSNFWPCPVMYDGIIYPSSEHAFVAAKTTDESLRKIVLVTESPGQAKRIGRQFKLRDNWEEIKIWIMKEIVTDKFNRNPDLAEKLLATGAKYLEEGNWWNDRFWGVCNGFGQNNLGKILMEVREELRHNRQTLPEIGSHWAHKNGNEYEVICITNEFSERQEEYPITIVYKGSNGKIWSRPLDSWHKSMKNKIYPVD